MEFDFQRYIQERRREAGSRAESGLGYAFARDRRVMRTMSIAKPVKLALVATPRLASERFETLSKTCQRVSSDTHPQLTPMVSQICEKLRMAMPIVLVAGNDNGLPEDVHATALCIKGEDVVVLAADLLTMDPNALGFIVGRQLGHVQHGHALYLTAGFVLARPSDSVVSWIVKPAAKALEAWVRLGDITADRAGLIACSDLEVAVRQILGEALPKDQVAELDVASLLDRDADPDQLEDIVEDPLVLGRIRALCLFASSEVFRSSKGLDGGDTLPSVDTKVEAIIKLW